MKKSKSVALIALCAVLAAASLIGCGKKVPPPAGKICLFKGGQSDYSVVLPGRPTEAETYAAEELTRFIEEATGVSIPTVSESDKAYSSDGKGIYIGGTDAKAAQGIRTDFAELDTDGFVTQTDGNNVFLSGAHDRGTLYAAYDFLEKYFGVRFLSVDETYVPEITEVYVSGGREVSVPAFARRDAHFYNTINNPDFSARLRLNGVRTDLTAKHGYGSKQEWSEQWAHTLYMLLPPSVYYDAHPDWYGNVPKEDVEKDGNKKMCFTDPELRAELVKNLKQWIVDQPLPKYFAVAQEDNSSPCKCADCVASDAKYTFTGSILKFVNDVARDIEAWRKTEMPEREILIEAFAYQQTEIPPVKLGDDGKYVLIDEALTVPDNVVIRLAPIWSCFSHGLFDESCADNAKSRKLFEGWGAVCDKIIMWTYGNNFTDYVMFFNNFGTMAGNYQIFKENSVVEVLDQGAFDSPRTNFQELRIYLEAKLQWDPYQDVNALTEEFCRLYYGIAGEDVLRFKELFELHYASLEASAPVHMWCWNNYEDVYSAANYPKRLLEQSVGIFDDAFKKIGMLTDAALRDKLYDRALAVSLIPRYYIMLNYITYYDESTKKDFVDKWFDDAARVGLTRYYEGFPLTGLYDRIMS